MIQFQALVLCRAGCSLSAAVKPCTNLCSLFCFHSLSLNQFSTEEGRLLDIPMEKRRMQIFQPRFSILRTPGSGSIRGSQVQRVLFMSLSAHWESPGPSRAWNTSSSPAEPLRGLLVTIIQHPLGFIPLFSWIMATWCIAHFLGEKSGDDFHSNHQFLHYLQYKNQHL